MHCGACDSVFVAGAPWQQRAPSAMPHFRTIAGAPGAGGGTFGSIGAVFCSRLRAVEEMQEARRADRAGCNRCQLRRRQNCTGGRRKSYRTHKDLGEQMPSSFSMTSIFAGFGADIFPCSQRNQEVIEKVIGFLPRRHVRSFRGTGIEPVIPQTGSFSTTDWLVFTERQSFDGIVHADSNNCSHTIVQHEPRVEVIPDRPGKKKAANGAGDCAQRPRPRQQNAFCNEENLHQDIGDR